MLPGEGRAFHERRHVGVEPTQKPGKRILDSAERAIGGQADGARALGLGASHGTLEAGKAADLAVWDIERPAELAYRLGFNPLAYAVKAGRPRS